ncbi:MAG: hypothetical protein PHG63_03755 [Candidatus Dojkabacteria bacterium]|nr:hypothetical protein [Candidatus Dojkabacteria bacterium]
MSYDRALLKSWAEMETWDECLDRAGALNKFSSKEGFDYVQKKYFSLVENRIRQCKMILRNHQDSFLYWVIAELYDRADLNQSPAYLYKRAVRYYAMKALEFDPDFTKARTLLAKANDWVEFIGGDRDKMPEYEFEIGNFDDSKEF